MVPTDFLDSTIYLKIETIAKDTKSPIPIVLFKWMNGIEFEMEHVIESLRN